MDKQSWLQVIKVKNLNHDLTKTVGVSLIKLHVNTFKTNHVMFAVFNVGWLWRPSWVEPTSEGNQLSTYILWGKFN